MKGCPSPEQIRLFLAEKLPEGEQNRLAEHIDHCPECLQSLSRLAKAPPAEESSAGGGPLTTAPEAATACLGKASPWPAPAGYEILGVLGQGGMGVVYKARQVKLNRIVALKMIRAGELAGESELARFKTEAEAIARLRHDNIVQIYDIGEHDGLPYFSLEYCSAGSLAQKLAGQPLPPQQAAALLESLALGMQAAHQANVIHRDLKPANVLLQEEKKNLPPRRQDAKEERKEDKAGERRKDNSSSLGVLPLRPGVLAGGSSSLVPKITDFGLAKKLDEAGLTRTGEVMGTPSYMAPEQIQGKKDIGPAADVWALGVILYECLTGRPPFKAANAAEIMLRVLGDELQPPRRIQPHVPIDLETICLKCLRKGPEQRYGSAADLAADLRAFLDGRPIQARPTPRWERAWKWSRRRPAWVLAGLFLLVAVLGLVAGIWQWRRAQTVRHEQEQRERAEEEARQVRVEYYRAFLRREGVLEGVGRIDEEVRRHRHSSVKIYRRGGLVVKMEHVNGHDQPTPPPGAGTMIEGVDPLEARQKQCSFELSYNKDGEVVEQVARNRSRGVVYGLHYTSRKTALFTGNDSYVRSGRGSDAAHGAYGRAMTWNDLGLMSSETFLDVNGKPALGREGFATTRIRYDNQGNAVEVAFLGVDGKPAPNADGVGRIESSFDEYGNVVETSWLAPDGQPISNKNGYQKVKARYDDWGNLVETAYFDAEGRAVVHKDGYHRRVAQYDERGLVTEQSHFDRDGRPTLIRTGFHKMAFHYDDRGNPIEATSFGYRGRMILNSDGYATVRIDYDANGNQAVLRYFGTDGKPTMHKDGSAIVRLRYDRFGNKVEQSHFGLADEPTLTRNGIHKIEFAYKAGNNIERRYLGLDGKTLILHRDGGAVMKARYDDRGNMVEQTFFGTNGKPTLTRNGFHKIVLRYDDHGWVLERRYFAADGKTPILHKDGHAVVRSRYDRRGRPIEESYLAADDKPTWLKSGIHRLTARYDVRGNQVETTHFGMDGRPVLSHEGIAGVTSVYDDRGNIVEQHYFGLNRRLVRNRYGYAGIVRKVDERGNVLESAYLDANGKLTLGDQGYAKLTARYDERGRRTEERYFVANGKPVTPNGFAALIMKYDDRDNKIEELYLGSDGKPVAHPNGCFRLTRKVDLRGTVTEAAYRDAGGRLISSKLGYARIKWRYDARGNRIEEVYENPEGKPAADQHGRHWTTWIYDERDNKIEESWKGKEGKPALFDGHSRFKLQYDKRGNVQVKEFFIGEAPARVGDGYSRWSAKYDPRDRVNQRTFAGYDGGDGFDTTVVDYNEAGAPVEERFYWNNLPARHRRLGYTRLRNQYDGSGVRLLEVKHFDEANQLVPTRVVIAKVLPGSQAAAVGLQADDVLVSYDGKPIASEGQLAAAIRARAAGPIRLTFQRAGKEQSCDVKPGRLGVILEDRAVRPPPRVPKTPPVATPENHP
jgi:YD repeat-containing protein